MKKKILLFMFFISLFIFASCGAETETSSSTNDIESSTNIESDNTSSTTISTVDQEELNTNKSLALSKLDEIINPIIAKITDEDFRNIVQKYYDDEKQYINAIVDLDAAKAAINKVVSDTKDFALNTFKPFVIQKLNGYFNPLIQKLPDEDLKNSVQNFYTTEMDKISDVEEILEFNDLYKEILDDVKEFIKTESERILIILKNKAIEELDQYVVALINKIPYDKLKTDTQSFYDVEKVKIQNANSIEDLKELASTLKDDLLDYAVTEMIDIVIIELDQYVTALINKIPYETLKTDTQAFYTTEKNKLNACESVDDVKNTVEEIKDDLIEYAISETKKISKTELDSLVEAGLNKIYNEELKTELNNFYDDEMDKLMAVEELEDIKPTLTTILQETEDFLKNLTKKMAKDYLNQLLGYEKVNPFDYIPEAMRPTYGANLVSNPVNDFTSFVNVSNMNRQGYGEQWQMVLENLNQMLVTTKALEVVESAMSTVAGAMNIYIENSASEDLDYSLDNEIALAELSFEDGIFYVKVDFKNTYDIPLLGESSPILICNLDTNTMEKSTYIALNNDICLLYKTSKTKFELGLTYGVTIAEKTGARTSYFVIDTNEDGVKSGHIYEYTSFGEKDLIKACADFYIENGYVSVIGNKASGILGFSGFINELYKENDGRLLGYKVQEELTIAGVTGTYHTLWFNLWDINGINNVKVTEKTKDNKSDKSTVDSYINNSSSLLVPTYNKLVIKTSRKYDIELRNRYVYDVVGGKAVCTEVKVPMMFIQDDNDKDTNFTDFPTDFFNDNNINLSVNIDRNVLEKIRSDYDTYIPLFKTNKENMSAEKINTYLSQYSK